MNISYLKTWVDQINKLLPMKVLCDNNLIFQSFDKKSMQLIIYETFVCFEEIQNYDLGKDCNDIKDNIFGGSKSINLKKSIITNIHLLNNDKILQFDIINRNIYNEEQLYCIIIELIPRFHNVILCKCLQDKNIIISAKKHISLMDNHTRQILPGAEYRFPETNYIHKESEIVFPINLNGDIFNNINDYFVSYYHNVILQKQIDSLKNSFIKSIEKDLIKNNSKLDKQLLELNDANKAPYWLECVELLKINLNNINLGMEKITVIDFYNNSSLREIQLNPKLSPHKNLNFYVKKYRKAVTGLKIIEKNIEKTKQEIDFLESKKEIILNENDILTLKNLKKDNFNDINNIKKDKKLFRYVIINNDWEINIGRSSKENDLLTCKTAKPEDWWFHSRIYQGTHVVLRNKNKKQITDDLVVLCSGIAAFYSKAKNSSNVPVDYTQIKYVRKPKGSPPGFVVYKNQKTIFVNPSAPPVRNE